MYRSTTYAQTCIGMFRHKNAFRLIHFRKKKEKKASSQVQFNLQLSEKERIDRAKVELPFEHQGKLQVLLLVLWLKFGLQLMEKFFYFWLIISINDFI